MAGFRLHTVQLASGPRIHYAEHGDSAGETVVFLHGWPDSWFSFSRVVERLPSSVHAVLPDQRGFGNSDRPGGRYDIAQFADDVAAFLDALSIKRATLVGHSFGSFVARRVALTYPERVATLILIGTGATGDNAVTREVHAALRGLPDPIPVEFAREFQASTAFVTLPPPFFERLVSESMKLPAPLWRQVFKGIRSYDDRPELAALDVPTLVLWGEKDALFGPDEQRTIVQAIPGATLKVYAETGHCPNWERPAEVAHDILAFLQPPSSTAGKSRPTSRSRRSFATMT